MFCWKGKPKHRLEHVGGRGICDGNHIRVSQRWVCRNAPCIESNSPEDRTPLRLKIKVMKLEVESRPLVS